MIDPEFAALAYKTIEAMRPGKKFTVRLLTGMTGFAPGTRPRDYDGEAMTAIAKADFDELIYMSGVKPPSHRAGYAFVWTRYEDDEEEGG